MPLFNDTNTEETQVETPDSEVVETPVTEEPAPEPELNIPSIELIVEDGTGVSDANSYCDLDYALEYCVMKGYTDWVNLTEDEQKIFLIRGTEFVDNFYTWKGTRHTLTQSMAFPRDDIYDIDRFKVYGIPDKLKKACIEAAWLNTTSGGDTLFSSTDVNGKIKKQKVDALEVEYFEGAKIDTSSSEVNYTTIYDILNKLLKGLYRTTTGISKVNGRLRQTGL